MTIYCAWLPTFLWWLYLCEPFAIRIFPDALLLSHNAVSVRLLTFYTAAWLQVHFTVHTVYCGTTDTGTKSIL